MALAHILAPYVAPRMRPTDTGLQDLLADFHRDAPVISGLATTAAPPLKSGGVGPMIRREVLANKAQHQRNLRQAKAASLTEAKLLALTTEILRGGNG